MGRKLRSSSVQSTADELLSSAPAQFATKQGKSSLKTLISTIPPSSDLVSSLPRSLHLSISQTLESFKKSLQSQDESGAAARSSVSPPSKRARRSSRGKSPDGRSGTLAHLKKLECYAFITHLMISHPKKPFLASDLLPSVQLLHDSLVLYEMDPALLSLVANLCEEWWKEKISGREMLIPQSLPFFLSKSLSNGKKADVHRVYSLRDAFVLFDYVDESIEDMRLLLVRCVIAPVYLKTDEGRKFIAFMMGLNDQLAKEALALIKSQIPFGRKSVLEAYAGILFRSWKGSEGSLRDEIEDGFVQGLIDAAIHASLKPLAASIRRVLGGFIEQRATDGVEKLLFRLSEPLLFRSLQAANSNVRQNALHLFLDLFPLEDPDVTKEVKDTLFDKQFFLLEKLLLDDCPDVRAVAVEGSCRILNLFWEVIPSPVITKILTKIIDSMSNDVCNEVRLSTVNGIIYLLENPQSHEIMKVLLPRLGCMFSDPTLSVRVAVTDLILAIRDIRTFQFNKVVGLDALLSSLANDHPRIAQKITRLLIPSYFPAKMNLKEACGRCIALIKRSPIAGARFCEFALSEGSSSKSLIELLRISISLGLSSKGLNSDQIDGLFVASANICCSLSSELSNKTALSELFPSSKLKCLFTAAASPRAQTAVLTIASVVSSDDVAGLRDLCMASIMNCTGLADSVEMQALIRAAHKFMLSYGWFDELFGVLTSSLQSIASGFLNKFNLEIPQQVVQPLKKKKVKMPMKTSGRLGHLNGNSMPNTGLSKTREDLSVAIAAAWQMKDLLTTGDARNKLLKSPNLEIAFSALSIISQVSIEQCSQRELLDTSAVMAYTAFAMHISLQNADATSGNNDYDSQSTNMPPMLTILENSLSHLLNCAEKLFPEPITGKSSNPPSRSKHEKGTAHRQTRKYKEALSSASAPTKGGDVKADLPVAKVIENVVKMATSILKLIVDAATIGLITRNNIRCLKFASSFARYVISFSEGQLKECSAFEDKDLKDVLVYLKSSFSYASKLLHLVLTSSSESSVPPREAFYLANDLLDLIVTIELSLGSKYASHVFSVAKPWLPVLILGLGSNHLIKAREQEGTSSSSDFTALPLWLVVLGKSELYESTKLSSEQDKEQSEGEDADISEPDAPIFKKLMEIVVLLLKKGNLKVLDAVGGVLLTGVNGGLLFPAVVAPNPAVELDLVRFTESIRTHKHRFEELLRRSGAVFFRGFPVRTAADFDRTVDAFGWEELPYVGGAAPRSKVVGRVFTANESPPDQKIPFHHEMAQVPKFPSKLFFFCEKEPRSGGETPIVLSHYVYERMKEKYPEFVEKLEELGLIYTRVLGAGDDPSSPIGRGWQSTFLTKDKSTAEERAAQLGMKLEWMEDGVKTIMGPIPAIKFDETSGRKIWFNSMVAAYTGWKDARNDPVKAVTFGDGTPLPADIIDDCLKILEGESVAIPWKQGDILLLDNLAVLHSRKSFDPPRRILASLCI